MIGIKKLEFNYPAGNFSLYMDELNVEKSATTAIIGPSGTGKTTLLNLIAGIMTPKRGVIDIGGTDVCQLNDKSRRKYRITTIGFVFQDFELLDYLNVLDNILLPCRISPALRLTAEIRQRAVVSIQIN